MKVLFVLEKRVDAGSIHAVAKYVRASDALGHTIALYGYPDPKYPDIRFSLDAGSFDYVVFIIESGLHQMSHLHLAHLLSTVPRSRRAVLDTDGMYNELILLNGYDRNHANDQERSEWLIYHGCLADKVLQPTLHSTKPGMRSLPFFGYDPTLRRSASRTPKKYDLIHVGHNWWRWQEMSTCLLPAIERIRGEIGDICFVGSWWDSSPSWAPDLNLDAAFRVDSEWLRRLKIETQPAVTYTEVINTMDQGRVNIMTQRPLLRSLELLTSKYFEIFYSDTIPLVLLDPDHAESVYGPAGRELAVCHQVEAKILDALRRPKKYLEIVREVRRHLQAHHSFRHRVEELVSVLQEPDC